MTYRLQFDPRALKEWSKLGHTVKDALRKKLKKSFRRREWISISW